MFSCRNAPPESLPARVLIILLILPKNSEILLIESLPLALRAAFSSLSPLRSESVKK